MFSELADKEKEYFESGSASNGTVIMKSMYAGVLGRTIVFDSCVQAKLTSQPLGNADESIMSSNTSVALPIFCTSTVNGQEFPGGHDGGDSGLTMKGTLSGTTWNCIGNDEFTVECWLDVAVNVICSNPTEAFTSG